MPEVGQILIMEWKLCMEINNRRQKMSIEEMERIYRELRGKEIKSYHLPMMFGLIIDSLKDIHEENCKLWKELAKMKGEI